MHAAPMIAGALAADGRARSAGSRWPAAASGGRRPRGRRPAACRRPRRATPPMTMTRRVEQADGRRRAPRRCRARPGAPPGARATLPARTSATTSPLPLGVEPGGAQPRRRRRRRWRRPRGSRCCRSGRGRRPPPATWMWPRSPAAPCGAAVEAAVADDARSRCRCATLTNSRWSTLGQAERSARRAP